MRLPRRGARRASTRVSIRDAGATAPISPRSPPRGAALGASHGIPLALVRPGLVRVRGQLDFVWPDAHTITRWANGRPPRGVVKTRLTDDRRRVVLVRDEPIATTTWVDH